MKLVSLILAGIALSSCAGLFGETGNGVSVDQAIEAGEFDSISVPSSIDVIYTQTPGAQSLTLTCDENLVDFYMIAVENGTLVVKTKPSVWLNTKAKTYLTVNSPVLNGVRLSGSGDVYIKGPIAADGDFNLSISGSGDIAADGGIVCRNLSSHTSGSGDTSLAGVVAETAEFKNTGSGDIKSQALTAEQVSIALSGSGDCTLVCKDAGSLDVKISGSGDVVLSGTARHLSNISITGSGKFDVNHLTWTGQ